MAKTGRSKNTVNKAKHKKLMDRKKKKLRSDELARKERLKALQKVINAQKGTTNDHE